MSIRVRLERDDDVAIIVIDSPPINAASAEVRAGLLTSINVAATDDTIHAVVIIGAGSTFIAGSDLREFGQPLAEPQLPTVIGAIEACPKPVVAALHGAALGGGFEVALGCDGRMASAGTVVGLPEVTLGVIPGAGGTQRLPRLVGIPKAIRIVCSGERLAADEALSLGLLDEVVTADLRAQAARLARSLQGTKVRVRDRLVPACDEASMLAAAESALRAGKNRPAVRAAIDAILAIRTLAVDAALAQERALFQSLRTSREARALRHLFFAEREAARFITPDGMGPRPVKRVAIIGAGTMGAGIAIAALDAGYDVSLLEREEAALAKGVERIHRHYVGRVEAGKIDVSLAIERQGRLAPGLDWSAVRAADLIIEAAFEDMKVKQQIFARLAEVSRPGAVLASNTSYLDLDAIAAASGRARDVVGLHFFSPAHVMRLLEIVRGTVTGSDVLATCLQLAKSLHKVPVVSANAHGFIANRIYAAYRRQCEFMLEEGALPEQIDAALEAFGFAMGPFAVADLSGLDIAWQMRRSTALTRDPQTRYVRIPDLLCELGRLGQKTGAGYYLYDSRSGARQVDPVVEQIIIEARAAKRIIARSLDQREITQRALLSMVNEASLLLGEGVARRASDIDVVMVNGFGFPRWEGGPMFWAREHEPVALQRDIDWLAALSGSGFVRGDVSGLSA